MNPSSAHFLKRMKALPFRLRLAHLEALLRQAPAGSARAKTLLALLRDQLKAAGYENRIA